MKRHTFDLRVNMDLAKWLSSEISVNYQLETAITVIIKVTVTVTRCVPS